MPGIDLFLAPFAGGGQRSYVTWTGLLPDWIRPVTLSVAGRETRRDEPEAESILDAARDMARQIEATGTERCALFGHSVGGLVAFETARALRAGGVASPDWLIVSSTPAPSRRKIHGRISDKPDAEVIGWVESLGGTEPEVLRDRALMGALLPLVRHDARLAENYAYEAAAPLDANVAAFGSPEADLQGDDLEAWGDEVTGLGRWRLFPGGHFYFLRWPDLLVLDIARCLGDEQPVTG